MFLKIIMVMAGIAALAVPAFAGARENALNHTAQAIAASKTCSKVTLVEGNLLLVAVGNGVDFERDQQELMTQVTNYMRSVDGESEDARCFAAIALYGPEGMNVPGLLEWK